MEAIESRRFAELFLLSPPNFPALREELERVWANGAPYHVVHFDVHRVYDKTKRAGGLYFEDPLDVGKYEQRFQNSRISNVLTLLE
ncbi:MAG: hypothetical protein GY859_26530 [Desulfobacterales bacterium]|nr:hypothetical protein [Desulfobacterales bacterium]